MALAAADPNRIISTTTKVGWGLSVTVEEVKADGSRNVYVNHDASNSLVVDKFRGIAQQQAVIRIEETRQAEKWQTQQVAAACWVPKNRQILTIAQPANGWV